MGPGEGLPGPMAVFGLSPGVALFVFLVQVVGGQVGIYLGRRYAGVP